MLARSLRSVPSCSHLRARRGVVARKTFTTLEFDMIAAGLLAMLLVSADTSTRIVPLRADTMTASAVVAIDVLSLLRTSTTDSVSTGVATGAPRIDSGDATLRLVWPQADTTVKKKRVLVEYSDWYGRRLAIHRTLSWAMIPLFAVSYYTGDRLARDGRIASPAWVRTLHPYAATGASVVFGVNTVTGLWNLWDARHDPQGRVRRIIHSVLFLAADGGFAYAGSLGKQARDNSEIRSKHRAIALYSMGVSYVSMMIMLLGGK